MQTQTGMIRCPLAFKSLFAFALREVSLIHPPSPFFSQSQLRAKAKAFAFIQASTKLSTTIFIIMIRFTMTFLFAFASFVPLVSGHSTATMVRTADLSTTAMMEPIIIDMKKRFAENDFIRYVAKDDKIKSAKAFLPYMSFFGNSFSDINTMVLPYKDPQGDELKQAINAHSEEDATHLFMLWDDLTHCQDRLEEMGLTSFQDTLKFLWSEDMYRTRELGYEMARVAALADKPVQRYCMIRVMEELGQVFLKNVASRVELEKGKPSKFLGQHHLDMEDGCLQTESLHGCGLDKLFVDLEFESEKDRDMAEYAMHCTYDAFSNMLQCMYDNIVKEEKSRGKKFFGIL